MPDYLKKNYIINLIIIITIFLLDRISKFYVIFKSETNLSSSLFTSKFLNINLIWNEGIAFGLFSFSEKTYYNILTILIIAVTLVIFWMILKSKRLERLAFMMIFSGSLGNIFDRLFYSAVPDFIDFHIKTFHWFIFNVADIFITIGVIILIYNELFLKNKKI
ncbi:MAG: signal peptidase II [Candidatus Pelagibacter sp.]